MAKAEKLPAGIRKRGDRYQWRFTHNGQRYSGSEGTKTAAVKAMNAARYEAENGTYIKESNLTVDQWFSEWIETIKGPTVKGSTRQVYVSLYSAQIAPIIGKMQIRNITALQIQRIVNEKADQYTGFYAAHIMGLLCEMLTDAYKHDIVKNDIGAKIDKPNLKENKVRQALTLEQQEGLLTASSGTRPEYMIKLILQSGLRIGELLGLQWSDIDQREGVIKVRHTLEKLTGQPYRLKPTKTRNGSRDIPLTEEARNILKLQAVKQKKDRLKAGTYWKPAAGLEDLIFTTETGAPIPAVSMMRYLKPIKKEMAAAGLETDFSYHHLRHTFGTRCYDAGMDIKVLQEIMGHGSFNTTMSVYVNKDPGQRAAEMKKVEAAL